MKFRKVKLFKPGPWEYGNGFAKQTIVMQEVTLPIWLAVKMWWLKTRRGWVYIEAKDGKLTVT